MQEKISKGILLQWENNHACHRSVCLFARDCFTWITLHVQMLTGEMTRPAFSTVHFCLCFPDSQKLFSTRTKTKDRCNCSYCFYAVFHNSLGPQNNCGATKWHFRCLMFEYHLLTGPVVAFSARLGTAGWPLQAHSSPPLIPGLTQCIPVEGISLAFFKIFVHL